MIRILPLLYILRYMKDKANGYLEVILGPMFSGKTSKIIEIYKQYSFCGIRTLVINHSHDTRYGEENINGVTETITTNVLYSHDQKRVNCIYSDSLLRAIFTKLCNFIIIYKKSVSIDCVHLVFK